MFRTGFIVPLCLSIVSGCTLIDSADTVADKNENPVAVVGSEGVPVSQSDVTTNIDRAPIVAPRRQTPDDIRRWQMRLREVGLDPGPIDGVAGAKTKAAFNRLQSGCVQLQGLLDASGTVAQPSKAASRQETLKMQMQLRDVGFNPGPADGIFGSRTKAVLNQLQNSCPTTKEFAASFAGSDGGVDNPAVAAQMIPERPSATRSLASQSRVEAEKQSAAPVSVRPQEDIRILQLRLRDAGFDPGPFDGVMGPKTRLAMQQFQASQRNGKTKNALVLGRNGQY